LGVSPSWISSQLGPTFTLIDFESINTGGNLVTSLPNPFVVGDVTFASVTGTLSIFDISVSGWAADGTEVASKTLFPGGEPDSAISIAFANPVAQFLLGWGDPNFQGNVLRAFDGSGHLLEEASVALDSPGGGSAAWIGFTRSTADIAMIVVQPDQSLPSGDDYVIDNIRYSTTPVPEPGTLLLLVIGALAGIARQRRNRPSTVHDVCSNHNLGGENK
jgi:hypothetical protein